MVESKTVVAIKKLKKKQIVSSRNGLTYLLNEIRVHWSLETCNSAVRLLSLFEDQINVYIVLEFQPKGSLMTVLECG